MDARNSQTDDDFLRMPAASMDVDAALLNPNEMQVWMEVEEDIMEDGVPNSEYRLPLPPCRYNPLVLSYLFFSFFPYHSTVKPPISSALFLDMFLDFIHDYVGMIKFPQMHYTPLVSCFPHCIDTKFIISHNLFGVFAKLIFLS